MVSHQLYEWYPPVLSWWIIHLYITIEIIQLHNCSYTMLSLPQLLVTLATTLGAPPCPMVSEQPQVMIRRPSHCEVSSFAAPLDLSLGEAWRVRVKRPRWLWFFFACSLKELWKHVVMMANILMFSRGGSIASNDQSPSCTVPLGW